MLLKQIRIGDVLIYNNVFLAPMAGVTDLPFRLLCKRMGCGLVYSEMVSAKGLMYDNANTLLMLNVSEEERPVSLQIFGSEPEVLAGMVRKMENCNIDIIDINMGCPAPKIVKNGEGSALMRDIGLVARIVSAVSGATRKPVTVKFRKGFDFDSINAVEVAKACEENGAAAVAVHGRTRTQYYSGNVDWGIIRAVKENVKIPVIGNGDVTSASHAERMLQETGCDAIMIGRAAQGNPWIFREVTHYLSTGEKLAQPCWDEKIRMAIEHGKMLTKYKGEYVAVREMRKHLAWYTKGMPNSAKLRTDINAVETMEDIFLLFKQCL